MGTVTHAFRDRCGLGRGHQVWMPLIIATGLAHRLRQQPRCQKSFRRRRCLGIREPAQETFSFMPIPTFFSYALF